MITKKEVRDDFRTWLLASSTDYETRVIMLNKFLLLSKGSLYMSKTCVYCNTGFKISSEHLVSASVLKVLYGPKIENTHHGKKGGQWKTLNNFEGVIKDVCRDCNSKLSHIGYDNAGRVLASEIISSTDKQPLCLTFNKLTLGWLLKTHLNIIRDSMPTLPRQIELDKKIFHNIQSGEPPADKSYMFICQAIDIPSSIWSYVSSLNTQVSIVNEYDLVISQLRIRQFDTFFVFSASGSLEDISEKENIALVSLFMTTLNNNLQKINICQSLAQSCIVVERTINEEQFLRGIMTTDEYEKIFKSI